MLSHDLPQVVADLVDPQMQPLRHMQNNMRVWEMERLGEIKGLAPLPQVLCVTAM